MLEKMKIAENEDFYEKNIEDFHQNSPIDFF